MTDLALDPLTHDLVFEGGDLSTVTDGAEIEQSLKIALLTGLGEWAFDTAAGVAYRNGWRVRPINSALINADVRRVCLGVAGVLRVDKVSIDLDAATRHVTVGVEVTTIYGEAARSEVEA
jgi:hypothetical protein